MNTALGITGVLNKGLEALGFSPALPLTSYRSLSELHDPFCLRFLNLLDLRIYILITGVGL